MNERYKAIAQKAAQDILLKTRAEALPVDVKGIIESLGIAYLETDELDDSISGFIKRISKDGRPIIVVNKTHTKQRRRFTAAHELGHYLLHSMDSVFVDTNEEKILFRKKSNDPLIDIKEIQANNFAAELLMPRDRLLEDLGGSISIDDSSWSRCVADLSTRYNVSSQAMTIRIGSFLC